MSESPALSPQPLLTTEKIAVSMRPVLGVVVVFRIALSAFGKDISESKGIHDVEREKLSEAPVNSVNLHHPFIQSNIIKYEYSSWYFLFFVFFDKKASLSMDVSSAANSILSSLSSKLSAPVSIFSVSKVEMYPSKSLSVNVSINDNLGKLADMVTFHQRLCSLQESEPLFKISGIRYKLVRVIHSNNKYKYYGSGYKVFFCFLV